MVVISILVWDAPEYTENLLRSLLVDYKPGNVDFDVYILDQGSGCSTKEILKQYSSRINVITLEENVGFSRGHNMIYEAAKKKHRFEYFCPINSDVQLQEDCWLDKLVAALEKDPLNAIAGPFGVNIINYGNNLGSGMQASLEEMAKGSFDFISGSICLVRAEVADKLGLFDEAYSPAYFEDVDMNLKYKKTGFKLVYCPVMCRHGYLGHMSSTSKLKSKDLLSKYGEYQEKNRRLFVERWGAEFVSGSQDPESCRLKQRISELERNRTNLKNQLSRQDQIIERYEKVESGYRQVISEGATQNWFLWNRIQEINGRKTYRYARFAYHVYYYLRNLGALRKRIIEKHRSASINQKRQQRLRTEQLTKGPRKETFHDAKLKVLHVAFSPLAGAPVRMCRLLDTSSDISAISVCSRNWYPDGRIFDYDIVYDPKTASESDHDRMRCLLEECDIVHFHNESYFKRWGVLGDIMDSKPVCLQWHSGPDDVAARLGIRVEEAAAWHRIPTLVVAQKHARFFQFAIPVPNVVDIRLPEYQMVDRNTDIVRICYSPTDQIRQHSMFCGDKGEESILATLEVLKRRYPRKVEICVVRNMPLPECLKVKQQSHICIDDVKSGGFHINSLEGLALGCVTVANLDEDMEEFLVEYVGCRAGDLPWYKANEVNIMNRLEELIQNRDLLDQQCRASRAWMERYWNHEFVQRKMKAVYEDVLSKWSVIQEDRRLAQTQHMRLVPDSFGLKKTTDELDRYDVLWDNKVIHQTSSLQELGNGCTGDCFLVGAGPSVNEIDFNLLKGKVCFGVNGSIAKFREAGFVPGYFAVTTLDFFQNRFSMVREALQKGVPSFFPFWGLSEVCKQDPNLLQKAPVYLINELNKQFDCPNKSEKAFEAYVTADPDFMLHKTVKRMDVVGFSNDLVKGYFNGENILYTALQIAYYIGYRRFFILGMDLDYSGPNPRFYETVENQRPTWLNESYERSIVPCFEIVRDMCKEKRMEVYNVSPKSRLPSEIIPKISFSEAIELPSSPNTA